MCANLSANTQLSSPHPLEGNDRIAAKWESNS
jgi:hypothetical protein